MNCETTFFMLTHSKARKTEVVISKGSSPKESLLKGIEQLGGISRFIKKDDQVFIKFNLTLPGGFPLNANFDVLDAMILCCKEAGANKIYLGSFPIRQLPIKVISDLFNLKQHVEILGAKLVFLDNSDNFENKEIDEDQLKNIKYESLTKVKVNNNEFFVPNIILNSNKFISVNQVNVNPLFKLNLSLLNLYSIVPPQYRAIEKKSKVNLSQDQYKKDLISKILDVYAIKQPDLIINDCFYILESAGPYIYKDSNLKTTNLMILSNDTISADVVTLNTFNLDPIKSDLIQQLQDRNIEVPKLSSIKILGEEFEDVNTDLEFCVSELKDIRIKNFTINSGNTCTGCFNQAYHLLNFMKTNMGKDLKYNPNNAFIIGENPPEPNKANNYILFGDCAINNTKNYKFRKIIIKSKKDLIAEAKSKIIKEKKSKKKIKVKEKQNKNILELPGCPPNIFDCLELILKYFGKKSLPNLNLLTKINEFCMNKDLLKMLRFWEAL